MTALQIAYAHCANWRKDGKGCLGAMIDDDLQIRRIHGRPKCLLGTPGERCEYFEECVAPMGPSIYDARQRAEFEAAVRDYRLAAKLPAAEERPCPVCGGPIGKGRRFCDECAAAKRREATRRAVQRHRVGCKQLAADGPLETKGFVGVEKGGRYGDSGQGQNA
jgi:hypothetical protein